VRLAWRKNLLGMRNELSFLEGPRKKLSKKFRLRKKGAPFLEPPSLTYLLSSYFFMPGTASGSIPYRSLKVGTLTSAATGW
jgi:hypothetical protein